MSRLGAEWRAKEGLERGGQMSRAGDEFGGLAQQRSSWLIPLVVFFVTACLSAIVLAYYFAPGPPGLGQEMPSPTDTTRPVTLTLGPQHFRIPANYILLSSARRGGALNELSMAAVLPEFRRRNRSGLIVSISCRCSIPVAKSGHSALSNILSEPIPAITPRICSWAQRKQDRSFSCAIGRARRRRLRTACVTCPWGRAWRFPTASSARNSRNGEQSIRVCAGS